MAVAARAHQVATGSKLGGRQSFRLLWASSKPLCAAVLAWAALDTVDGPLVIGALGFVVGAIPGAVRDGMSSPAGHRLITALVVAALLYAVSLDPRPGRRRARHRGQPADQRPAAGAAAHRGHRAGHGRAPGRRGDAEPAGRRRGLAHRLLPRRRPGDLGRLGRGRLSGVVGCAVIAAYFWWLGLLLLVMWLAVRRVILKSVLRQAIDMRGQTTEMRRAWYYTGVGSKARDAKEVRVFGLARFFAGRYAAHFTESIRGGPCRPARAAPARRRLLPGRHRRLRAGHLHDRRRGPRPPDRHALPGDHAADARGHRRRRHRVLRRHHPGLDAVRAARR